MQSSTACGKFHHLGPVSVRGIGMQNCLSSASGQGVSGDQICPLSLFLQLLRGSLALGAVTSPEMLWKFPAPYLARSFLWIFLLTLRCGWRKSLMPEVVLQEK